MRPAGSSTARLCRFAQNDGLIVDDLVEIATGDAGVAIDAAVAEEGPVAAGVFEEFGVDLGDEDLFLIVRSPAR